jgi:hypothetical protein
VLFDYLPANRAWFGTWHTVDLAGAYRSADLRWFTLQGSVSDDGAEVDLGIYRTSGGAFDSAPAVPSQRVGDATLRFDGCDSANLQYRFRDGDWAGVTGAIPLRLLTPSGGCALIGAAVMAPPASERGGIGNHHSGTWYAPATSGQGIEATIRPDLGHGLVFAGWFTFDPQDEADDATAQHWFTLQGDLSAASNASVTLPIYRSIGGAFDRSGTRNTVQVGQAEWHFIGCNRSELQYHFDTDGLAGAFAGRSGTLQLQRLEACPP